MAMLKLTAFKILGPIAIKIKAITDEGVIMVVVVVVAVPGMLALRNMKTKPICLPV